MAGANQDYSYSTLEVAPATAKPNAGHPYTQDGLQVVRDDAGKEYVPPQPNHNHSQDPIAVDFNHAQDKSLPIQRPWWKKKRFFVTGIVLLLTIAVGVGVGVGVSLSSDDDDSSSSSPGSSSPPTDPDSAVESLMRRSVAAVSLEDGSTNRTWVFYQNNDGKIVRSGATSPEGPWTTNETGSNGKRDSVLAAAVSRPGFPMQLSVFYVGDEDVLHDTTFSDETGRWEPGTLADERYTIMPNSSIAALYNQCQQCSNNTIIAFQDVNGFVQIGNLTREGWSISQLGNNMAPAVGTGLALHPFIRANTSDQINLYYQKADGFNLTLAAYQEVGPNNADPGWRLNAQTYDAIPFGAPIATASAYSNVTSGLTSWIQLLSLSGSGVKVNSWRGSRNTWVEFFASPSVLANSTVNAKLYGNLAMTATGGAFAVTQEGDDSPRIQNWQLNDDFTSWTDGGAIDAW